MARLIIKELQYLRIAFAVLAACLFIVGILIIRREIIRSNAIKNIGKNTIEVPITKTSDASSPDEAISATNTRAPITQRESEEKLSKRALELCSFIPDHKLDPEAKRFMTAEFYNTLSAAFDAPVANYGEIGENEWLAYFVTGNGGTIPSYAIKGVTQISDDIAQADIAVKELWEDGSETGSDEKPYSIMMKKVKGVWLLDDFDGKKGQAEEYVKMLRKKYASGEIINYLKSDDYTKQYVPDFERKLQEFYKKHGK